MRAGSGDAGGDGDGVMEPPSGPAFAARSPRSPSRCPPPPPRPAPSPTLRWLAHRASAAAAKAGMRATTDDPAAGMALLYRRAVGLEPRLCRTGRAACCRPTGCPRRRCGGRGAAPGSICPTRLEEGTRRRGPRRRSAGRRLPASTTSSSVSASSAEPPASTSSLEESARSGTGGGAGEGVRAAALLRYDGDDARSSSTCRRALAPRRRRRGGALLDRRELR